MFEMHLKEIREENQLLYKNEDRAKRLIEENEILKSDVRAKEREIVILNDRISKISAECESYERENKRLSRDLNEKQFTLENLERNRGESSAKNKETEKRLYEIHREKQDIDMKVKIL